MKIRVITNQGVLSPRCSLHVERMKLAGYEVEIVDLSKEQPTDNNTLVWFDEHSPSADEHSPSAK